MTPANITEVFIGVESVANFQLIDSKVLYDFFFKSITSIVDIENENDEEKDAPLTEDSD